MERLEKLGEKKEKVATLESEHEFFVAKLNPKFQSYDWAVINDYNEICVCLLTSKLPHQSWYKIEV